MQGDGASADGDSDRRTRRECEGVRELIRRADVPAGLRGADALDPSVLQARLLCLIFVIRVRRQDVQTTDPSGSAGGPARR